MRNIQKMSREEIPTNTKYIIEFEDHGQDFLKWYIDKNGYVLDSRPFQKGVWIGILTRPQNAEVGHELHIWNHGEGHIIYPIRSIELMGDE